MPPNIDLKPLSGRRDNAIYALNELFVEFETLYSVKPELNLLAAVFNVIESKYRAVKKQIEEGEKRNHHRSFHNEKKVYPSKSNLDPNAPTFNSKRSPDQAKSKKNSVQGRDNEGANNVKNVPGVCPVQKIRVRDSEGNFKTLIAMLDTGSNTSPFSKRAAKLLCLSGPQTHLIMNLAGGQKRGEVFEVLEIVIESPVVEDIRNDL